MVLALFVPPVCDLVLCERGLDCKLGSESKSQVRRKEARRKDGGWVEADAIVCIEEAIAIDVSMVQWLWMWCRGICIWDRLRSDLGRRSRVWF